MTRVRLCLAVIAVVAPLASLPAQTPDPTAGYDRTEVMIPMRDGVKLHTLIFVPRNAPAKLPVILERTPYGIDGRAARDLNGYFKSLADDGYIFVFQDIRGRYKSEGKFVMQRPPRPGGRDSASTRAPTPTTRSTGW